jgi:hypothetical protein
MTAWQSSTNRLWEFFKARELADGWHASFGGAILGASRFPSYDSDSSWPGFALVLKAFPWDWLQLLKMDLHGDRRAGR